LTVLALGLAGCRQDNLLTPPTSLTAATETEMRPAPVVTPQPAAIRTPTLTLLPSGALFPGSAPALPPVEPTLITHGDRSRPLVALTFDACQTADRPTGYDESIIKILTATGTPATLFLGGRWMQWHPTQTQALAANPLFELGDHSWSHPDFASLSAEEMSAEILRTQNLMVELTGRQPALFRFPFDASTDEALAVVSQYGLRAIGGDVVTGDPDPHLSTGALVKAVTGQVKNGSIVIMHMNAKGRRTAEALPAIIERLHARGYTFVTVSQLLGVAPGSVQDFGNIHGF
jgi:peptidoglycan/xylan/chitin deacetylase (PgdA/CDA1 family)